MGFDKLLWGFVFFFDLRIQHIDILPDFFGYILLYAGLTQLKHRHPLFAEARPMAFVLIFLSVPGIYEVQQNLSTFQWNTGFTAIFALGLFVTILDLFVVYRICRAISLMAEAVEEEELAKTSMLRWKLYLVSALIAPLLLLSGVAAAPLIVFLAVPLFVFSLVVLILMIGLMQTASRKWP